MFHALITARSRSGPPDGAGVLAHARSTNFTQWEVLPPLTDSGEFAQVEVPQLVQLEGRNVILFSCLAEDHSGLRLKRLGVPGRTGTFAFSAKQFSGPYSPGDAPLTTQDARLGTLYAGKLIEERTGGYRFMAFRGDGDRHFLGELTDPLPAQQGADGHIVVLAQ
jgi:beta-fructofuranosidase